MNHGSGADLNSRPYNLAQGAVATAQGVGASLSGPFAGIIVDCLGYSPAFILLGSAAVAALAVFALFMPETADSEHRTGSDRRTARLA